MQGWQDLAGSLWALTFPSGLALTTVGNKWNLSLGVIGLSLFMFQPLLFSVLFFLQGCFLSSLQVLKALLLSLNNYWLLNVIDSARCFKFYPTLTASLQGSKRWNDFQGHKLIKRLMWDLNLGLPDCKGNIFVSMRCSFTKPPTIITRPQELFRLQVFSQHVHFSSDQVALLSGGSAYILRVLSSWWMGISILLWIFYVV